MNLRLSLNPIGGALKMIISEQQIFELYDIARMCGMILVQIGTDPQKVDSIALLLETIRNQQSTELKEVK